MTDRATVDKSIQAMQNNFQPSRADGLNVTYRLLLTGDGGGSWGVYIKDKQCKVREGAPRRPNATITMNINRYFQLSRGELNVGNAYKRGEINVTGNPQLALKFVELFPAWDPDPKNGDIQSSLINGSFEEYQPFAYKGDVKVWKKDRYPEMYGKF